MCFANLSFLYSSLRRGWLLHCTCPLLCALCISSSLITVVLPPLKPARAAEARRILFKFALGADAVSSVQLLRLCRLGCARHALLLTGEDLRRVHCLLVIDAGWSTPRMAQLSNGLLELRSNAYGSGCTGTSFEAFLPAFDHLLGTNEAPAEIEIPVIQPIITDRRLRVDALSARIDILRATRDRLITERDKMAEHVKQCTAVLVACSSSAAGTDLRDIRSDLAMHPTRRS
ncbi:hypothetical protein B0H14DRAFT_3867420 [Mycena olivaceomarginata]|nr:hypothetical protein B0H14DRAFT_3867420 [Mycena olivaceomarginata]